LIAATIVPGAADAGPVRAAAAGTATAVTVTGRTAVRGTVVVGRTAAKGTAVVGRTAVRGTAAAGRGLARGTVCICDPIPQVPPVLSLAEAAPREAHRFILVMVGLDPRDPAIQSSLLGEDGARIVHGG